MKFLFLLILFVFSSRSLHNERSRDHCNEAWHYVIQLVFRLCNDFLKLKIYFCYLFIWLTIKSKIKMSSGRNIMCERTLTNLLVYIGKSFVLKQLKLSSLLMTIYNIF